MKTLKIEIPKGFEVDSFNKETGEIKFKETPKNIIDQIKTFDDVLKKIGISRNVFNSHQIHLRDDEIAYKKLKLIVEVLNEGWMPDWSNPNECKYYPWFDMDSSSASGFSYDDDVGWRTFTGVGSRLCFKSRELAEYAGKQFKIIYKEFMIIK